MSSSYAVFSHFERSQALDTRSATVTTPQYWPTETGTENIQSLRPETILWLSYKAVPSSVWSRGVVMAWRQNTYIMKHLPSYPTFRGEFQFSLIPRQKGCHYCSVMQHRVLQIHLTFLFDRISWNRIYQNYYIGETLTFVKTTNCMCVNSHILYAPNSS